MIARRNRLPPVLTSWHSRRVPEKPTSPRRNRRSVVDEVRSQPVWLQRLAIVLSAVAVGFLAGFLALQLMPDLYASEIRCRPGALQFDDCVAVAKERAASRRGVTTATLALFAGVLSAIGALYTARTYSLSRSGHVTDRFTRATDQLGSPQIDVRMGGIYALERIAAVSDAEHPQVMELLSAFVREHAPQSRQPWQHDVPARARSRTPEHEADALRALTRALELLADRRAELDSEGSGAGTPAPPPVAEESAPKHETRPDVWAALRVIGRAERHKDRAGAELNFKNVDLREIDLSGTNFQGANFARSNLTAADLRNADLRQADLGAAKSDNGQARWGAAPVCTADRSRSHARGSAARTLGRCASRYGTASRRLLAQRSSRRRSARRIRCGA
jgi:hypothetical protein